MDLYELLEINENNFNINSLKKNYHKMCLKHHTSCEHRTYGDRNQILHSNM